MVERPSRFPAMAAIFESILGPADDALSEAGKDGRWDQAEQEQVGTLPRSNGEVEDKGVYTKHTCTEQVNH
jgi:hypothetical protein